VGGGRGVAPPTERANPTPFSAAVAAEAKADIPLFKSWGLAPVEYGGMMRFTSDSDEIVF